MFGEIKRVLVSCRKYVELAQQEAEAKHDSHDSGYYMDSGQYEVMQETEDLLDRIDYLLGGYLNE